MKHLFAVAFIAVAFCLNGQSTRSYPLSDFAAIELSLPAAIQVTQGRNWLVEISADKEALEDLSLFVEAGTLHIEREGGDWWEWIFEGNEERGLDVRIVMPALRSLDISGAAEATIEGFSGKSLDIDIAGAAELIFNGQYDVLTCELAGAGELELTGGGERLVLDVAGAADIQAKHYIADVVEIDGAGAVDATVHARQKLVIDIAGAGEVRYAGNPSEVIEDISGAAEVHKIN